MCSARVPLPEWVVATLVFVIAAVVLLSEARYSPFEIDESGYIATSRYFGYLVLERNVSREEWGVNYWTLTQPPLTRYVIGLWLSASGYDLEKLNEPYVSTASSYEVNVMKGRVPTDDVLWRSRQPLALLGAGAIGLLYLFGARVGGVWVGLVTAALALSSSFIRYTFVHVWAEGPLAFFFVLSALLAVAGAPALVDGRRWVRWTIGLGLALAVATSVKMTGVVGIVALGAWAVAVAGQAFWSRRTRSDQLADAAPSGLPRAATAPVAWRALRATGIVAIVVGTVWVAVNPFLWRGPLVGTWLMIANRAEETAYQQEQWPEYAVHDWAERPWLTLSGSVQVGPFAETPLTALVNLPLLAMGLVAVVGHTRRSGVLAQTSMLIAWVVTYFVVIVLGLGLKYPRYFMPTTLLFLPVVALGLILGIQTVWNLLPRALGRPRPAEQGAPGRDLDALPPVESKLA
jgi:hypothetical protein